MKAIIPILLISILASCSYEKRLTRAKKKLGNLVAEFPALVQHDTIMVSDTTIVPGVVHDTIFRTQITKDTITIIDKQLTIKYYNDGTTTYLKGVCDTVWAIKEIPVQVHSINPVKEVYLVNWYDYVCRGLSLLAILFIIFDQLAARRK